MIVLHRTIFAYFLPFLAVLFASNHPLFSQNTSINKPLTGLISPVLHIKHNDSVGVAGNQPNSNATLVNAKLEAARQKYVQALALIDHADTVSAAKMFEEAIKLLDNLSNYPGIEANTDFTDLAQSIIEDYDSYIQNIDNLDTNSSIYILREKIFQALETASEIVALKDTSKNSQPKLLHASPAGVNPMTGVMSEFQIPLTDNEYVQNSIKFFTENKGHKFFQKWLERTGRWFPMMRRIAKEENVPEELIYLSMIESGMNPRAISKASAVGLWQFMRTTGELYGLKANYWFDERRDPEKATRAAMKHMRDLYAQLGDWHLVLAAYNCGLGGVKRAITRSHKEHPNYWEVRNFLPKETRNYVPLYIATAKISLNPEMYGFNELQFHPKYDYETFPISEAVDLKALAKCSNTTPEILEELNSELLNSCTPPNTPNYVLKLPVGIKSLFATNYSKLPEEEKRSWVLHEVRKNETLQSISDRYGSTSDLIISANNLSGKKKRLHSGDLLRVPFISGVIVPESAIAEAQQPASKPDELEKNTTTSPEPRTTAPKTPELQTNVTTTTENTKNIQHRVSKGETLHSISKRYGVRIADLRNWNNIPYDSDEIVLNDKLVIFVGKEIATNEPAKSNAKHSVVASKIVKHKVRAGETLAQIADDYDVSVASIAKLNGFGKKNKIQAGETLKIQTTSSGSQVSVAVTNPPRRGAGTTHKVRKGESLYQIAETYGVSRDDIASWNPSLVKKGTVYAGTQLKIFGQNTAKGSASASAQGEGKSAKTYKIRKGDTLAAISRKFGVSISHLQKINKNIDGTDLQIGQNLKIQ